MVDNVEKLNAEEEAAIQRASLINNELKTQIGQVPGEPLTPLHLRIDDEALATVNVPRTFLYRPDVHRLIEVKAGIQKVPERLTKEAWWINNGVTIYTPEQSDPAGVAFVGKKSDDPLDGDQANKPKPDEKGDDTKLKLKKSN